MKERIHHDNQFADMIIEKNWNKMKKSFIVKNVNKIQFPKLSIQDLELLTVGSYQLKQDLAYAIQYIATTTTIRS